MILGCFFFAAMLKKKQKCILSNFAEMITKGNGLVQTKADM